MKKKVLFFIALLLFTPVIAQEAEVSDDSEYDSTIVLPHIYTYIEKPLVEQRQVFTSEEIEAFHVSSLPELFNAAGVQVLSYGAYGLLSKPSIRGFTDETVIVVLDGVIVNNAQNGTFDFTSISPSEIEKIEIVRGGFTEGVTGEGSVGGVIYITTKKQTLGQNFSSDIFSKTYFNKEWPVDTVGLSFSYSGQTGEASFLKTNIKGTFAENAFLYKAYDGTTRAREHSCVYDGNFSSSFMHYFGSGSYWSISDLFYAGYKNTPNTETSTVYGLQQDYNNNLTASLVFPSLCALEKTDFTLSYQSSNEFYSDTASSDSKHILNTGVFTGSTCWSAKDFFEEKVGLTLSLDSLNSTDDGSHTLFSGTLKETSKVFLGKIFSFSVPLSFSFSGENFAFIPKMGGKLSFYFVDVMLNFYRMVQFPIMNDLYWAYDGYSEGNPDLEPEKGWGGELTFNAKNIFIPFSFCIYSNYYAQKIQWAQNNGIWRPENVASAFYLGFNLTAEKTLWSILTLRGNAEYLYTALLDESESLTYGKRIMYTPDLVASLTAVLSLNFLDFTLEANYTGKRYISNLNISYLKPYLLLNASATLKSWNVVKPYFRLDNILNVDYESVPNYPMPGISLTVGVKSSF